MLALAQVSETYNKMALRDGRELGKGGESRRMLAEEIRYRRNAWIAWRKGEISSDELNRRIEESLSR